MKWSVKILLEVLNIFKATNLTLSLDVDQDTWESDKNTRKHNTQESQEVSLFPAGDHKAAMIRQDSISKTNMKHN